MDLDWCFDFSVDRVDWIWMDWIWIASFGWIGFGSHLLDALDLDRIFDGGWMDGLIVSDGLDLDCIGSDGI